jgi:hypothetical protein
MIRVFVKHTRDCGLCASGCRLWFAKHGLNWTEFLERGMTADQLRATGSELCEQVIAAAERDHGE